MTRLSVTPLSASHLPAAAGILADRQRLFRRDVWPAGAACYEHGDRCLELLARLVPESDAFGAFRGQRLVGFVAGSADGRLGLVPAAGHAVDDGEADISGVYGTLYVALAERWIERGALIQDVEIPALTTVEDAWNSLGFGRRVCIGSRTTDVLPSDLPVGSGLDIRVADPDDVPSIVRLAALEVEFRSGPPMYLEGGPADHDRLRNLHLALFETGAVQFVARIEREIVGILTLLPDGRFAPICSDNAPFVSTTVTDPGFRQKGIGRMLVRHAADWARERQHGHLDVSYQAASPLLRAFWQLAGFVPIGWKVARRLPESRASHPGGSSSQQGPRPPEQDRET